MNTLPDFPEKLGKVGDVADYAGVSTSLIYKMVEAGRLPCIRVGTMIRFDMAAVKRFFAAKSAPAVEAQP